MNKRMRSIGEWCGYNKLTPIEMSKPVTEHIRKTQVGFSVPKNSQNHLAQVSFCHV